jgi:hypothetical protein
MISIIRKSLKDENKLKQFNDCIDHAKSLTEKKRYYFGKFEHSMDEAIVWWKKKATKRYEKLQSQGRLRTQLEIWEPGADLEIIR